MYACVGVCERIHRLVVGGCLCRYACVCVSMRVYACVCVGRYVCQRIHKLLVENMCLYVRVCMYECVRM